MKRREHRAMLIIGGGPAVFVSLFELVEKTPKEIGGTAGGAFGAEENARKTEE